MARAIRNVLLIWGVLLLSLPRGEAAVGLQNRLGAQIPIQAIQFNDEAGKAVQLSEYFQVKKPVILALAYYGCPGTCSVLLNRLTSVLKLIGPSAGRAFEVVIVSIDPNEASTLALKKKAKYLELYGRNENQDGWHFLTGDAKNIENLSQKIGFQYEYDPKTNVFSHPAAIFVLTPNGVVSDVLSGTEFTRKSLKLALYAASRGHIQAFFDRLGDRWGAICSAYLPHRGVLNSPTRWLTAILISISLSTLVLVQLRRQPHNI